jgi:hypothetical protein
VFTVDVDVETSERYQDVDRDRRPTDVRRTTDRALTVVS